MNLYRVRYGTSAEFFFLAESIDLALKQALQFRPMTPGTVSSVEFVGKVQP